MAASPETWQAEPGPGALSSAGAGLARARAYVRHVAESGFGLVRHPSGAPSSPSRYASAFSDLFRSPASAPGCSLNTAVGYDLLAALVLVRQALDGLRQAAHHYEVTLNDLLLTAVGAGVHDLLSGPLAARSWRAGGSTCWYRSAPRTTATGVSATPSPS